MTPTTKAALDAAEKALLKFQGSLYKFADPPADAITEALRLIAEAREAEEGDTARLDWLIANKATVVEWETYKYGVAVYGPCGIEKWLTTSMHEDPISAIDAAMAGPTTCTACDEPITGQVHYDVNQLPFDADCYEDLCRAMASVPEGEK